MNHMSKVAELLEVELGEEFRVDNYRSVAEKDFRLTEDGLEQRDNATGEWIEGEEWVLNLLLIGEADIIHVSPKPRKGEQYYVPRITTQPQLMFDIYCWNNNEYDKAYYRMGIICKNAAEAIELTQKMLAVAKNRE